MSKASSTEESDMTGPFKGWTGKGVWLNLVPVPFLLAGLFCTFRKPEQKLKQMLQFCR